jgi:hypothetical protein
MNHDIREPTCQGADRMQRKASTMSIIAVPFPRLSLLFTVLLTTGVALSAVLAKHRGDGRVLLWDLMNEPDSDEKWTEGTRAYLRDALPLVNQLDPNHLTTVGLAWRIDRLREIALPDVLQYHEYCPKAQLFEKGSARVSQTIANQRQTGGTRPLLIGEFGMSTACDPEHGAEESLRAKTADPPGTEAEQARLYEIVLSAAEQDRVAGVLPWCLHEYPINNPNEAHFGLVRGDGSLKPAAMVLQRFYRKWREPSLQAEPTSTTESLDRPGRPVSPLLYGIFFEEIHRAGEGGVYAEKVMNRSFEQKTLGWSLVQSDGARATMATDQPNEHLGAEFGT